MSTGPVADVDGSATPAAAPAVGAWVRACGIGDLPDGAVRRAVLGADGPAVAVVRVGDLVHSVADRCSHADFRLSEGEVVDGGLECPLHGALFDLRTGAPDGLPATRPVAVHAVRVRGDDVLVDPDVSTPPVEGARTT